MFNPLSLIKQAAHARNKVKGFTDRFDHDSRREWLEKFIKELIDKDGKKP